VSEGRTEQLAAAFCDCSLPKSEWTHEAHLRVGLWHLLRHSPEVALERLRERIQRYNVACGVANTDSSGYHESITRFYVRLIATFVAIADLARPIDELSDELVRNYGDRELPMQHWSKARLMSPEARRGWVEPDLRPLE
jgi:hypothetical protein